MTFALAVSIAISFWGARHVQVPCQPVEIRNADAILPVNRDGEPVAMATYRDTCQIWISSADEWLRHQPEFAALYCADIAHEVGHLGGLEHTETGLMAPEIDYDTSTPYECVHWRTWAKRHEPQTAPAPSTRICVGPGPRNRRRVIRRNSPHAASNTASLSRARSSRPSRR